MSEPKTIVELFDGKPERWTQGPPARDENGLATDLRSMKAVRWCLWGAYLRVYEDGFTYKEAAERIKAAIVKHGMPIMCPNGAVGNAEVMDAESCMILFNEYSGMEFKDVWAVVQDANV